MKPDGGTMETTEPTEAAALVESTSLQENVTEEAPCQPKLDTETAPKAKDDPPTAEPKVKSKADKSKIQSTASAGAPGSRLHVEPASHHTVNDKFSAAAAGGRKATASKASAAGAVPKRPASAAAGSSTARNQTKVLDKRPAGPAKTTSTATAMVTNGTRPKTMNGPSKRPAAEAANGARLKTTTTANKTAPVPAPKHGTSAPRPGAASSKATRPPAVPWTSRATATKPSTTAAAKPAAPRVPTAPSAGRTLPAHVPKTAATVPKKDLSRPPLAAVTKKPTTDSLSLATKKHDPSKPTMKLSSGAKGSATTTKAAETKAVQSKPNPTKRPAAALRPPQTNKLPSGRTPPVSPASKPGSSSSPVTKHGAKPTQTVSPFMLKKKTAHAAKPAAETQGAASSAAAAASSAAAAAAAETPAVATEASQQELPVAASVVEEVSTHGSDQDTAEVEPQDDHLLQSPVRTTPLTSSCMEPKDSSPSGTMQELVSSPAKPSSPPTPDLRQENTDLTTDATPSKPTIVAAAAHSVPQVAPPANLNDEEDEEREGSQLVSVSEMSGTTQPTEESRPGSGGPVGGSAWRAGGALLSELDSEEVSGSQQGASELSAPGVLEGTESTDDLGDGSLKGASAGSPDFEKVPDIPVTDFDDEDDSDRVCDMDVGSERTDEQQRPRHDNDVDEEEDDDVEMASEGVTESGLESYGNADEDDFAEDERLDNLNRVAQPLPPPPVLPSAPAAQWEQPNPFADPWAEPVQPQAVLDPAQAAASPSADPVQADPETPARTPGQDWQEQAPVSPNEQDAPQHSAAMSTPQSPEAQQNTESSQASVETPPPEPTSSTTPSKKTSLPEVQGDQHPDAAQTLVYSPQPDLDSQDLDVHPETGDDVEEEAEPETLPADEILDSPATAPLSNPSSCSVTEDEASDTEGEAQLNESSKGQVVINTTFEVLPPSQRALSTVEEGEEAEGEEREGGAGEEATPPSAASLTSYGLDSVTTASNSNPQSTESCMKSPGIFSLEELPEEAKDQSFPPQPHTQQRDAEQHYIECEKQEVEAAQHVGEEVEEALDPSMALSNEQRPEEPPDDVQPPYYSAVCEKTDDSFAGFTALPHRRDHSSLPRIYCDIVKPHVASVPSPRLSCADLPPRSPGQQARSPQLRRLEQHQKQLLELQQRREQQSRPLEEAELERKRTAEEEERKKKEEAEEELKRNERKKEEEKVKVEEMKVKKQAQVRGEEELKQRMDLQQEELKQRRQIIQWQQELQQTSLLSPSSGLCTIYEGLENSEEEEEDEDETSEQNPTKHQKSAPAPNQQTSCEMERSGEDKHGDSLPSVPHQSNPCPSQSPERPPPLDLDWGKKVDIVQQLINQTLLLNGDSCSSLLLLPGGAGGTLSPLESSLWPTLLPPLTPPSATVTSVSSFSPEATGSSPQGEWTVVELETHH